MSHAERIVNGEECQYCSVPFLHHPIDYPVCCYDCYTPGGNEILHPEQTEEYQNRLSSEREQYHKELRGVIC